MTPCWQHQPELRPSFAGILEHLPYCIQVCPLTRLDHLDLEGPEGSHRTMLWSPALLSHLPLQDPEVLNSPLPVELGPLWSRKELLGWGAGLWRA